MKGFHSPLLKAMPKNVRPKQGSLSKRLFLIFAIIIIIIIPVIIIYSRVLPIDGPGYIFYWLHDHIFLPIKGYSYTLFYPYSLSWWGPFIILITVWCIAYLTMTSIIKKPHIQLTKKIIHKYPQKGHHLLINTCRFLKKLKIEPHLIRAVTNAERKKTLHLLISQSNKQKTENLLNQFTQLTLLEIKLSTCSSVKSLHETHLEALINWQQAFLVLQLSALFHPQSKTHNQLLKKLSNQMDAILFPIFNYHDEIELKKSISQTPGFDLSSILIDLMFLASLRNKTLQGFLFKNPSEISESWIKDQTIQRLSLSIYHRRSLIDLICNRLEKLLRNKFNYSSNRANDEFKSILEGIIDFNPSNKPNQIRKLINLKGQLSLLIALNFSLLTHSFQEGQGYINSLEVLDFYMNCLNIEEIDQSKNIYLILLQSCSTLPEPWYYRLCADLRNFELKKYHNFWKNSVLKEDNTINKDDLQLENTRILSLLHSSGPDFDHTFLPNNDDHYSPKDNK